MDVEGTRDGCLLWYGAFTPTLVANNLSQKGLLTCPDLVIYLYLRFKCDVGVFNYSFPVFWLHIVVVNGSLGAGWLCCVHLLHSSVVTLLLYRAVSC